MENSAESNQNSNISCTNSSSSTSTHPVNNGGSESASANKWSANRSARSKRSSDEQSQAAPVSKQQQQQQQHSQRQPFKAKAPKATPSNPSSKNGGGGGTRSNCDHDEFYDMYASNNNNNRNNGGNNNGGGGSRKKNLNHLLNFTYESSRDTQHDTYYEYERYAKQFWSTKHSKSSFYSKEQFLQANCQFVVKSGADTVLSSSSSGGDDYSVHMHDPDLLVEWDKIEEIHLDSADTIACPICLHPPSAGKMTKCGHIYCWPCVLHYLSLSDKPWRKCVICFESIYKRDLKSVRVRQHANEYKLGDEIELTLMFKAKQSSTPTPLGKYATLILPYETCFGEFVRDTSASAQLSYAQLCDSERYAHAEAFFKLHSRSEQRIHDEVVAREKRELSKQAEDEKDQPEVCFVKEALELLELREKSLLDSIAKKATKAIKSSPLVENKTDVKKKKAVEEDCAVVIKKPNAHEVYEDAFEDVRHTPTVTTLTATERDEGNESADEAVKASPPPPPSSPARQDDKIENQEQSLSVAAPTTSSVMVDASLHESFTFFYQSSDGQRIYLSSLNARCLLSEYKEMWLCPSRVRARIAHMDALFMSDDNRRRHKYLSHLPLHSEFKLVELDLDSPSSSSSAYLSPHTLAMFESEIGERRRTRERKQSREQHQAAAARAREQHTLEQQQHYYVASGMYEPDTGVGGSGSGSGEIHDYTSEFPEASTSPTLSSGISVGTESTSSSSNGSTASTEHLQKQQQQQQSQIQQVTTSFAQMLKHPTSGGATGLLPQQQQQQQQAASVVWPSLETSSTQLTSGWLNMVKQQHGQPPARTRRYQDAPSPWAKSTSAAAAAATTTAGASASANSEEGEEESMPAPLYRESFFTAIDETLRAIETKKGEPESSSSPLAPTSSSSSATKPKAKKKYKQLLFSTSLNMGP